MAFVIKYQRKDKYEFHKESNGYWTGREYFVNGQCFPRCTPFPSSGTKRFSSKKRAEEEAKEGIKRYEETAYAIEEV